MMIQYSQKRSFSNDFLLFGILVVTIMLGVFSWFSWKTYTDFYNNINHNLENQASRVERSLADTISYTSYLVDYINNQIKENGGDLDFIEELLTSFRFNPALNTAVPWTMFSWVNSDFQMIVNSDRGRLKPHYDVSGRDYIPYTVKNPGKIILGKPVFGKVSNKWIIPAGIGVTDKQGKYLGTMAFGFNINSLTQKLEQLLNMRGVSFALINKDLQAVVESKSRYISENTSLIKKVSNFDYSKRSAGILSTYSFFGKNEGFSYYQSLPQYGYVLIIAYDKKLSSTEIWQILNAHFIDLALIILMIGVVLYILRKRIISPIMKLSSVADEISHGKENIEIPESNNYEIHNLSAQLKNVIDYMASLQHTQKRLEASIHELENQKDEAEVARATAEIAREEAYLAMQSKGNFLAKVAHEIQVPVNTVLDYADQQVKQLSNNSLTHEYIRYSKKIAESARFIMLLVSDLLDRAQAENDVIKLNERPLKVDEIITYSMDMLQTRAAKHGVEISMVITNDLPQLLADDLRMKQIINNLLSNAVKYTPTGGTVTIRASTDANNAIIIDVTDTGLGILPDEIDKITEDFYRINRHKEKAEGTGLGLPLAKRLMELHGGILRITSSINVGTHVTLTFPEYRTVGNDAYHFSEAI
jgi:signal transduction histidine kinase